MGHHLSPRTIVRGGFESYFYKEGDAAHSAVPRMAPDAKTASARAFVRSLNILLKFARLYGFDHSRTVEQLDTAWKELREAFPSGSDAGLLLGATGSQLLLDGVPLEGSPPERQFAQLLSAAGLASIHFFPSVTAEELTRFVRAFPTGKAKPMELAQQLKTALAGVEGIRINEICFVATDSSFREAQAAAQLTASALGAEAKDFKQWLNEPQKLLQLIAAAQGSRAGGTASAGTPTAGPATGGAGGGSGASAVPISHAALAPSALAGANETTDSGTPGEKEFFGILRHLTNLGHISEASGGTSARGAFQEEIAKLPGSTQNVIREALLNLAAQTPKQMPNESVLVRLAEHLAIRFALERYEHGEVKVNAVKQLLDRMNQEIGNLRKVLGVYEDKMAESGLVVGTYANVLDQQFWAAVPENGKRAVLLAPEAWCIPSRNVRQYVTELLEKGAADDAHAVLRNYAACVNAEEADARRKTAIGLTDLADLYATTGQEILTEAIRHLGAQLSLEQDDALVALLSAAFVALSQEASKHRTFAAMEQALVCIDGLETHRLGVAKNLRPKLGIEERIPELIDEALRSKQAPSGLEVVLRMLPRASIEQLTVRFNRCILRNDCERVFFLGRALGEEGTSQLRSALRAGTIAEAVETVGLLSRLDPAAVEEFLPTRLAECPRPAQDRIIRLLATASAPERGHLLLSVLDLFDPLLMPLAIDEIGMTPGREALARLLAMAEGDLPASGGPYLRLKAVEALGRLRVPEAENVLRQIAESKQLWRWTHPLELRIAAAQALQRILPGWVEDFLPHGGIDAVDFAVGPLDPAPDSRWTRQRRYARIRLPHPLPAVASSTKDNCRLEIKTISLGGGVAAVEHHLQPGTQVTLRLQASLRGVKATALMRDYRAQDMAFEIVDMNLEELHKFRHFLSQIAAGTPLAENNAETTGVATISR